jgi:hypothetical protein
MEKKNYYEKLKDPRWQKKRLEILERDKWACRNCGDKDSTLHIHHIFYVPKTEPWEIPNGLLITLCEDCHKAPTCYPEYKSCDECPEYQKDCFGPGDIPGDIITETAKLLEYLWTRETKRGCVDLLSIAISKLKEND